MAKKKKKESNIIRSILGFKIRGKRIVPASTKITLIFIVIILISNFSSNYINLILNRTSIIKLAQNIMIKDLTELYNTSSTQYDLFNANLLADGNNANAESELKEKAFEAIEITSMDNSQSETGIALGIYSNGNIAFKGAKTTLPSQFTDLRALQIMESNGQGIVNFSFNNNEYLGAYKLDTQWELFLMRADKLDTFYRESNTIFRNLSIMIVIFTIIAMIVGIITLRYTLRYIRLYTTSFMKMNKNQVMEPIDLKNAPNDDITFLGITFNVFAVTISNLMEIFRRFVSKDVAYKAYIDKEVKLEGSQEQLTILFSDIKSFTFITEILGNDIIKLLNVHYDKTINEISKNDGIIGSIIGDALLAVYGTIKRPDSLNKSFQALQSAYAIQNVTLGLRREMIGRREKLVKEKGYLTPEEEKVFKSVSIEVGVGIDGGQVFYGNIGSYERMTNTVIGDNVNNASRLEGLTRVYKVPVICSKYVKDDIESIENEELSKMYYFLEIDTVQVKGKTIGKKIYWPLPIKAFEKNRQDFEDYERGLYHYYEGNWDKTREYLSGCRLPSAKILLNRIERSQAPSDWSGIWVMKEK